MTPGGAPLIPSPCLQSEEGGSLNTAISREVTAVALPPAGRSFGLSGTMSPAAVFALRCLLTVTIALSHVSLPGRPFCGCCFALNVFELAAVWEEPDDDSSYLGLVFSLALDHTRWSRVTVKVNGPLLRVQLGRESVESMKTMKSLILEEPLAYTRC